MKEIWKGALALFAQASNQRARSAKGAGSPARGGPVLSSADDATHTRWLAAYLSTLLSVVRAATCSGALRFFENGEVSRHVSVCSAVRCPNAPCTLQQGGQGAGSSLERDGYTLVPSGVLVQLSFGACESGERGGMLSGIAGAQQIIFHAEI